MNTNTTAIDDSLPRTSLNPAALASLVALAGDRAAAAEASRRLDPGVARAVVDCGFARHFVLSRWGGTEGNFTDYVRAVGEVSRADAATGWCAAVFASVARMAGYLPPEGQRFLWADGPDTLIAGALMPRGTAQRLNGGWRLSGKWPFISGIHYAAYTMVCCTVEDDAGNSEVRYLAVPASSYQIEPTWFNVGMSATGSDTLVLDDVFVPQERSFRREELLAGRPRTLAAACHRVPLTSVTGLSFAAPALGAARGALGEWSALAAAKRAAGGPGGGANLLYGTDGASSELTLARTAGELDSAQLLLERVAAVADRGDLSAEERVRAQRDCALAADIAVTAANRLMRAAGTRGQASADSLQRFWRDANSAAGHTVLQFEAAARAYAGQQWGPRPA
jgi:two-component flavin-dependent monooxygenase